MLDHSVASTGVSEPKMEKGFAKLLADNDQEVRDKAISTLKKWLKMESDKLSYGEYLKLWKGLFYCMWMADKPKYQHELAERLAHLAINLSTDLKDERSDDEIDEDEPVDLAEVLPASLLYVRAFWETMCREWRGIDRLRLNKYYYLMQQFLKVSFELVKKAGFEQEFTCLYFSVLGEFPLNINNDKISAGVKIFVVENYLQVLKGLSQPFDAHLSMIMTMPLFESLSVAKDKTVRKALEDSLSTLIPNEESEDEEPLFDVGFFSRTLFDIGAEGEVADANRKTLYKLSELFKPFDTAGDEVEGGCCGCEDDNCDQEMCSDEECSDEDDCSEDCSDDGECSDEENCSEDCSDEEECSEECSDEEEA